MYGRFAEADARIQHHALRRNSLCFGGLQALAQEREDLGNDVLAEGPDAFRERVMSDMAKWKPLAHAVR